MLRIGMFLGDRYEILEKIGSGGMADVYKGRDHKLNRFIAIKVLKDEFVKDKNFLRKFTEEAQAAAGLAHPNIVNVYDVGDEGNIKYIVMELVEGITLKTYIERKGKLTIKEATSIAIQVSAGLEIAHNNQIIHRDIKPQNIIISKEGKVKVTDFGIAKSVSSNTSTSDAMGSVHYISPEQARGGYSDIKSDIYSLGIVMYEMVTGRVPFDGETTVVVAVKHLQENMTSPCVYASEVPVSLERIILKCCEKSPDRRYTNIGELQADLKQSLITPGVDFVKQISSDGVKTVAITKEDMSAIRKETGKVTLKNEYEDDDLYEDDDYENDYDEYEEDDDDYDEYEEDDDHDGLDPKVEKIMAIGGIVAAAIIVLIVVVILAKLAGCGTGNSNNGTNSGDIQIEDVLESDEPVEVPKLLGMSYSDAKETLNELRLGIKLGQTVESNDYEAGQIVSQSEDEGEEVERNTTITVDICGGGEEAEVPDVTDLSSADAKSKLIAAGFEVDTVEVYSNTVATGKVISTSPSAGKMLEQGSIVTMTISKGSEATNTVPNIEGNTAERAKEKLEAAGLTVGTVTEEYSDTYASGTIISQTVTAGNKVTAGTAVGYTLSKGSEKVSIGNYVGYTQSQIEAKLITEKGLKISYADAVYSDSVAEGCVVSYDPGNGSSVAKGSTVKVTLSKGKEVTTVTLPSLAGKTANEAKAAVEALGLIWGGSTEGDSAPSSDQAGKVYSQSHSGTVDKGTKVTVTVYGAYVEAEVDVPSVTGKTKSEAKSAIEALGFVFSCQTGDAAPEASKVGTVYECSATKAKKGDTITVTVYDAVATTPAPAPTE